MTEREFLAENGREAQVCSLGARGVLAEFGQETAYLKGVGDKVTRDKESQEVREQWIACSLCRYLNY